MPQCCGSPAGKAAFITTAATAARCFGKVTVFGEIDCPLTIPLLVAAGTLGEAAAVLGARIGGTSDSARRVVIGTDPGGTAAWEIHPYWSDWIAGRALGNPGAVIAFSSFGSRLAAERIEAEAARPDAGNSKQGAGNLPTGCAVSPFC